MAGECCKKLLKGLWTVRARAVVQDEAGEISGNYCISLIVCVQKKKNLALIVIAVGSHWEVYVKWWQDEIVFKKSTVHLGKQVGGYFKLKWTYHITQQLH